MFGPGVGLSEPRVLHGLRPRSRTSNRQVRRETVQQVKNRHSTLRENSLRLLCRHLLDWNLEEESLSKKEKASPRIEFSDFDDYCKFWLPLTAQELKACVLSTLQTNISSSSNKLVWQTTLLSGDAVFAVLSSSSAVNESDIVYVKCSDYTLGETGAKESTSQAKTELGSMDLVLFSSKLLSSSEISQLIGGTYPIPGVAIALGIITGANRTDGVLNYTVAIHSNKWKELLAIPAKSAKIPSGSALATSIVSMLQIDSLTSGWREFQAVNSFTDDDDNSALKLQILGTGLPMIMPPTPPSSPTCAVSSTVNSDAVNSTASEAEQQQLGIIASHLRFNPSQYEAMRASSKLDAEGFTLIQGPPGTGKTTTLIGIVNAIQLQAYAKFYDSILESALGTAGQICRQQICTTKDAITPWINLFSDALRQKERLLIVAPSNIAVDNIVSRIVERGFIDGSGGNYKPSIVRVGSNRAGTASAESCIVSLEETVEREIMGQLTVSEGKLMVDKLNQSMHDIAHELYTCHSCLLVLRDAFRYHPLPEGFELRVDVSTGQPYWVDHINRATSYNPPEMVNLLESAIISHNSVKTLPEFVIYSKKLTHLLNDLYKSHLSLNRLTARLQGTKSVSNTSSSSKSSLVKGARIAIESSILECSDIICSTLNSSGNSSLVGMNFQICVVDEACQATEPSLLIALNMRCRHCILIGDSNQLPATVFSHRAKFAGYDISLFERLLNQRHPFILLNQQYRMHPMISRFPSDMFYEGRVLDGPNVLAPEFGLRFLQPNPLQRGQLFAPCMFFNVVNSSDTKNSMSLFNMMEARVCIELIQEVIREVELWGNWQQVGLDGKAFVEPLTVGIISPYADQVSEIRRGLRRLDMPRRILAGSGPAGNVVVPLECDVNTVDGFQGKEKDIIIFSCVRANETGSIGFLSDHRRLNVALTRARFALFVVGNERTLISNSLWRSYIEYSKRLGYAVQINNTSVSIRRAILASKCTEPSELTKRKRDDQIAEAKDDNYTKEEGEV